MEQDSIIVMDNLENTMCEWKSFCESEDKNKFAYAVMFVINNLVRLQDKDRDKYIYIAEYHISRCLHKAIELKKKVIPNDEIILDIEWYKNCKMIIEKGLNMEGEFDF